MRDLLDLLRIPNVTTALSDIAAAAIITGYTSSVSPQGALVAWTALASAALYCGGMSLNDVADLERDRHERPERPIPSGRISRGAAIGTTIFLFAVGLGAAWMAGTGPFIIAVLLLCAIVTYDLALAGRPWLGPIGMASCRVLNLLLGFAAAGALGAPGLVTIALMAVYIFAITNLSLGETQGSARAPIAVAGLVALGCGLSLVVFSRENTAARVTIDHVAFGLCIAGLLYPSLLRLGRAVHDPQPARVGASVGAMVSAILWLDAGLALAVAPAIWLWVFFGLGVVQLFLRRSFPVT